ncbi:hypothetical protein HDU96_007626 [Phlyctochytrium bullatum]|nr:hypothetical protein HDU96_007626 [Phlyctochytrium bullatum]
MQLAITLYKLNAQTNGWEEFALVSRVKQDNKQGAAGSDAIKTGPRKQEITVTPGQPFPFDDNALKLKVGIRNAGNAQFRLFLQTKLDDSDYASGWSQPFKITSKDTGKNAEQPNPTGSPEGSSGTGPSGSSNEGDGGSKKRASGEAGGVSKRPNTMGDGGQPSQRFQGQQEGQEVVGEELDSELHSEAGVLTITLDVTSEAAPSASRRYARNELVEIAERKGQVPATAESLSSNELPQENPVSDMGKVSEDFSKISLEALPAKAQEALGNSVHTEDTTVVSCPSPGAPDPKTDASRVDGSSLAQSAKVKSSVEGGQSGTSQGVSSAESRSASSTATFTAEGSMTGIPGSFTARTSTRSGTAREEASGDDSTLYQSTTDMDQDRLFRSGGRIRLGPRVLQRQRQRPAVAEVLVDEILVACNKEHLNLHTIKAIDASGNNILTDPTAVDHVQFHPRQYLSGRKVLATWNDLWPILQSRHYYNIHTELCEGEEAFVSYRLTKPMNLSEVIIVNRHLNCMERIANGKGGYVELRRRGISVWRSDRIKDVKTEYCFEIDKLAPLPEPFSMIPHSEYHGFSEGELVHDASDAAITGIRVYFSEQNKSSVVGFEISREGKGAFRFGGIGTCSERRSLDASERIVKVSCGYFSSDPRICFLEFWIVDRDGTRKTLHFGGIDHHLVTAVFEPPEDKSRIVGFYGRHSSDEFLYGLGVFYA